MAQRVFLVQMPVATLLRTCKAICGSPKDRQDVAFELADEASLHLRRAAASERVADAVEQRGIELPEAWGLARNCMPYLCAEKEATDIVNRMEALSALTREHDLEEFFEEEVRALNLEPGKADRENFHAPETPTTAKWIVDLLDQTARLREKALEEGGQETPREDDEDDPFVVYALSTWVWLAQIFARIGPCFWQGRNRWLGNVAYPKSFDVQTNLVSIEPKPSIWGRLRSWFSPHDQSSVQLERIVAASRAATRASMASWSIPALQELLVSTAMLVPELAMQCAEEELPPEGEGDLASGAVRYQQLNDLKATISQMKAESRFPYDSGAEWAEIVMAAAIAADRAKAHLVEADDAIYGVYRWPLLGAA